MITIVINRTHSPLPIRDFDFVAHYDDEEGTTGHGKSEWHAVFDLFWNTEDAERAEAAYDLLFTIDPPSGTEDLVASLENP